MDPMTIAALANAGANVFNSTKPAAAQMPTNFDPIFGSNMFVPDVSGWLVNFGDGATQSPTTGPKTGPTLTASPVQTQPGGYSGPLPGSSGTYSQGGSGGGSLPSGALTGSIPMVYLIGGGVLLLVVVLLKKK